MNLRSNFLIFFLPNYDVPVEIVSSPRPTFDIVLLGKSSERCSRITPLLRQSCIQVLNLSQDKRSNASDIGEIIKRNQAMMANIIKIANSPAYYTRVPVNPPPTHAVALIGFDVIQAIIVAAHSLNKPMRSEPIQHT
jgi:HD-like signal output (HDOD) protein